MGAGAGAVRAAAVELRERGGSDHQLPLPVGPRPTSRQAMAVVFARRYEHDPTTGTGTRGVSSGEFGGDIDRVEAR